MMTFKPGTLGYELEPKELNQEDIKRIRRLRKKSLMKVLSYRLSHGEDIFESITDTDAARELDGSSIFPRPGLDSHATYNIPHQHPEEQVMHDYNGEDLDNFRY